MALIFFDGFNRMFDAPNSVTLDPAWWTPQAGATPGLSTAQTGAYGVIFSGTVRLTVPLQTNKTIYLGFAHNTSGNRYYNIDAATPWVTFRSSSAELLKLSTAADNATVALRFTQSSATVKDYPITTLTAIAGTSITQYGGSWGFDGWNFFEIELTLNASASTAAIRRNGMPLLSSDNLATVSLPAAINGLQHIDFSMPGNVDDLFLIDNTGAATNTWLCNARIWPVDIATSSTPAEWANGTAIGTITTDNTELSFISTSDINKTNVYGVTFSPTPAAPAIGGIQLYTKGRKKTLNSAYKQVYKHSDDVVYDLSSDIQTTIGYEKITNMYTINPATSLPWTAAEIAAGKFGVKSVTAT